MVPPPGDNTAPDCPSHRSCGGENSYLSYFPPLRAWLTGQVGQGVHLSARPRGFHRDDNLLVALGLFRQGFAMDDFSVVLRCFPAVRGSTDVLGDDVPAKGNQCRVTQGILIENRTSVVPATDIHQPPPTSFSSEYSTDSDEARGSRMMSRMLSPACSPHRPYSPDGVNAPR